MLLYTLQKFYKDIKFQFHMLNILEIKWSLEVWSILNNTSLRSKSLSSQMVIQQLWIDRRATFYSLLSTLQFISPSWFRNGNFMLLKLESFHVGPMTFSNTFPVCIHMFSTFAFLYSITFRVLVCSILFDLNRK